MAVAIPSTILVLFLLTVATLVRPSPLGGKLSCYLRESIYHRNCPDPGQRGGCWETQERKIPVEEACGRIAADAEEREAVLLALNASLLADRKLLDSQQEEIKRLNTTTLSAFAEREGLLGQLNTTLTKLEADLSKRERRVTQKEEELETWNATAQLASKEQRAAHHELKTRGLAQDIREKSLDEREASLDSKEVNITEQSAILEAARDKIKVDTESLAKRTNLIEERENLAAEKMANASTLMAEYRQAKKEADQTLASLRAREAALSIAEETLANNSARESQNINDTLSATAEKVTALEKELRSCIEASDRDDDADNDDDLALPPPPFPADTNTTNPDTLTQILKDAASTSRPSNCSAGPAKCSIEADEDEEELEIADAELEIADAEAGQIIDPNTNITLSLNATDDAVSLLTESTRPLTKLETASAAASTSLTTAQGSEEETLSSEPPPAKGDPSTVDDEL